MNILGLDMSSKKSGYSYFIENKLIKYGVWEMSYEEKNDWRERIVYMADKVNTFIQEHKIDIIVIEDVPPALDNSQTVKILSALQGCMLAICHIDNINIKFISVPTWKNKIGIDTTHSKEHKALTKIVKAENPKLLDKYKKAVKANEKKMSVDLVNKKFGLDLVYKSPTSKYNQDDIADSINIVSSQIYKDYLYGENIEQMLYGLYEDIKAKNK